MENRRTSVWFLSVTGKENKWEFDGKCEKAELSIYHFTEGDVEVLTKVSVVLIRFLLIDAKCRCGHQQG